MPGKFSFPDEKEDDDFDDDFDTETGVAVDAPDSVQVEVVDDTPEDDRDREPLDRDPDEPTDAELAGYQPRAKSRIARLTKGWNDERREKEKAQREHQAAMEHAARVQAENKRLREQYTNGAKIYSETAVSAAEAEVLAAKKAVTEAYESGDSVAVTEASDKLFDAKIKLNTAKNFRVPTFDASHSPENGVQRHQAPSVPIPDKRALAWQQENTWYGEDTEMTALALGVHERLVKSGVDPRSEEYWSKVDHAIRRRFPEKFEADARAPRKTKPSVVAPATRSTAPRKVRLTASELSVAKRLGVSPEDYAKSKITLTQQDN